jgi:hypothetical protein
MYRLPRPAAATAFHATMMRLEHFSAKWIRFAAKNAAQQRRELIPCERKQLHIAERSVSPSPTTLRSATSPPGGEKERAGKIEAVR